MLKRISRKVFIDKLKENGFINDPSKYNWFFIEINTYVTFEYMFKHYTKFSMPFWNNVTFVFKKDKKGIWRIYEKN